MRKTSKDAGDSMSVNSGVDDVRKVEKQRNSIKKKAQNFSGETDVAALVPLLQSDEKNERETKFALPKTKTDSLGEKDIRSVDIERGMLTKPTHDNSIVVCSLQNHMNTNVFGNMITETPKTSVLVEINEKKSGSNTPLIFTTAKTHADKMKTADPLTPVPILSTIDGNLVKSEIYDRTNILSGSIDGAKFRATFEQDKDVNQCESDANQLSKSLNKFADQVKTCVAAVTYPSHTTKYDTKTTNSQSIVISNTVLSKTKPDSTNSIKKLQRQKHTEDANVPQNLVTTDLTDPDNIKSDEAKQGDVKVTDIHNNSTDGTNKTMPSKTFNATTDGYETIKSPVVLKQDFAVPKSTSAQKILTNNSIEAKAKLPAATSILPTSAVKPTMTQAISPISTNTDAKDAIKSIGISKIGSQTSIPTKPLSTITQKAITTGTEPKDLTKSIVSSKVTTSIATKLNSTTPKSISSNNTGAEVKIVTPKVETLSSIAKPGTATTQKTSTINTSTEPKDKSFASSASTSVQTSANAVKTSVASKQELEKQLKTNCNTSKPEPKISAIPTSTHKMATAYTEAKLTSKPAVINKSTPKTLQNTDTKEASTKPIKQDPLSSVAKPGSALKTAPNTLTETKSPITKHDSMVKPISTQKATKENKGKGLPTAKTPINSVKADKLKSPTQLTSPTVGNKAKAGSSSDVPINSKTKVPPYIVATSKTKIGTNIKPGDDSSRSVTTSLSKPDPKGKSDAQNPPKS